jgi:FkbM family methyltransferase
MILREYIISSIIGTPLRRPAEALRSLILLRQQRKSPEMREIFLEHERSRMILRRAITPEMNCIDIGCHLGSVLEEIVKLAPRGRHIAIEPLAYKAAWLKRKFPRVEVHQLAVGERDAVVDFYFQPQKSGFSGLKSHGGHEGTRISVQCRRLDDIVPPDRPIGFIKIDVEGGEYHALRGARRVLAESRPIILFECTGSGLSAYGLSAAQFFAFLTEEAHYEVFLFKDSLSEGPPLDLGRFEDAMVYPFKAFNFIAAPIPAK